MKQVYQTKFQNEGNCFAACVASLFEDDIDAVPHLDPKEQWDSYETRMNEFLRTKYSMVMFYTTFDYWNEYFKEAFKESFYIVSGQSKSGYEHSVIYHDNLIAHDPNPANNGIEDKKHVFMFLKLHLDKKNKS